MDSAGTLPGWTATWVVADYTAGSIYAIQGNGRRVGSDNTYSTAFVLVPTLSADIGSQTTIVGVGAQTTDQADGFVNPVGAYRETCAQDVTFLHNDDDPEDGTGAVVAKTSGSVDTFAEVMSLQGAYSNIPNAGGLFSPAGTPVQKTDGTIEFRLAAVSQP